MVLKCQIHLICYSQNGNAFYRIFNNFIYMCVYYTKQNIMAMNIQREVINIEHTIFNG